jgi:hypothetical protein
LSGGGANIQNSLLIRPISKESSRDCGAGSGNGEQNADPGNYIIMPGYFVLSSLMCAFAAAVMFTASTGMYIFGDYALLDTSRLLH